MKMVLCTFCGQTYPYAASTGGLIELARAERQLVHRQAIQKLRGRPEHLQ